MSVDAYCNDTSDCNMVLFERVYVSDAADMGYPNHVLVHTSEQAVGSYASIMMTTAAASVLLAALVKYGVKPPPYSGITVREHK